MSAEQLNWMPVALAALTILSVSGLVYGWQRRGVSWPKLEELERQQPLSQFLVQILVCWVFAAVPFTWMLVNLLLSWSGSNAGPILLLAMGAGVVVFGILMASVAVVFGIVWGRRAAAES